MSKEGYEEVELDLDEKMILTLALIAHEKDITLNQLVNDILKEEIEKLEAATKK